jgi:L-fuconolactonase
MIDAHVHFWRTARGDNSIRSDSPLYRDCEPAELAPQLAAARIDRIVVVQAAATHAENLYTIGLARLHHFIAGVVVWIDPSSPAIEEEIAALRSTGMVVGCRPIRDDNLSIAWMADPGLRRGYEAIALAGMPLDILIEDPDELPLVALLARENPSLSIILDHCGKPDIAGGRIAQWARDLDLIAACPNVTCKFSGLLSRAAPGADTADLEPYASHVFADFGASRLMWASDWPPLTLAADYARWQRISAELATCLGIDGITSLTSGTATRVYGIKDPAAEERA